MDIKTHSQSDAEPGTIIVTEYLGVLGEGEFNQDSMLTFRAPLTQQGYALLQSQVIPYLSGHLIAGDFVELVYIKHEQTQLMEWRYLRQYKQRNN